MTLSSFVSILLAGIITNNMISVSATGADMAMTRSNTLKNSAIYGLVATIVIILSSIISFLLRSVLFNYGIVSISLIVALFVIAMLVQMAEAILEKFAPQFLLEVKYFTPLLACTCAIVALNMQVLVGYTTFVNMIFSAFSYSVGIFVVLILMGGVKHSVRFKPIPDGCEKVVVSLLILFIIAVAFCAF